MTVYPLNKAPIGVKLCQNAFQTIPNISFFDAPKIFFATFSAWGGVGGGANMAILDPK